MATIRKNGGFTLAEIMVVVAFISFLIAIAVPAFMRARELSRARGCSENLQKIDSGKQQWALENNQPGTATPTWANIIGRSNYIRTSPRCFGGGTYAINNVEEDPTCTLSTNTPYAHLIYEDDGGS